MTNGNEPAQPTPYTNQDGTIQHDVYFGLTKREHFALCALQSWISAMDLEKKIPIPEVLELPKNGANWAVSYADALIEALNK